MAKQGHVDQRLTNLSIQYKQNEFVGHNIFTETPVDKGSDKYLVYSKGNLFQQTDDKLSKNAQANVVQMASSDATYSVNDYGLKGQISSEDIKNADSPLELEADETEVLTSVIALKREVRQIAVVNAMSVNTASPSTKWTASAGTPVSDIEDAIASMFKRANTAIISQPVWDKMKYNADIIAKIGGGFVGLKQATTDMIAELFGLDKVIIGSARKDANKMPLDASLSYAWGKSLVLAYVDPRMSKKIATFGRLFAQKLGNGKTVQVRKWDDPTIGIGGSRIIQVEHASVEKVISEDFGYHLSDCIA